MEAGPEVPALPVQSLHRGGGPLPETSDGRTKAAGEMGVLCGHHAGLLRSSDGLAALPVTGKLYY